VGRACGTQGRGEKRVQDFGGKARRKSPLGGPRPRWEKGIKIDLREIGCGRRVDSPDTGEGIMGAVVSAGIKLRVLAPRG
jgi:hypothetical protein